MLNYVLVPEDPELRSMTVDYVCTGRMCEAHLGAPLKEVVVSMLPYEVDVNGCRKYTSVCNLRHQWQPVHALEVFSAEYMASTEWTVLARLWERRHHFSVEKYPSAKTVLGVVTQAIHVANQHQHSEVLDELIFGSPSSDYREHFWTPVGFMGWALLSEVSMSTPAWCSAHQVKARSIMMPLVGTITAGLLFRIFGEALVPLMVDMKRKLLKGEDVAPLVRDALKSAPTQRPCAPLSTEEAYEYGHDYDDYFNCLRKKFSGVDDLRCDGDYWDNGCDYDDEEDY